MQKYKKGMDWQNFFNEKMQICVFHKMAFAATDACMHAWSQT